MKKVLLGSTALIAAVGMAAPAQAQFEAELGGFFNVLFGAQANDSGITSGGTASGDFDEFGFETDSEVSFDFRQLADNGLTFSAQIQLETSDGDASGAVDEVFGAISGDFGRVEAGFNDGAVNATGPGIPNPLTDGVYDAAAFLLVPDSGSYSNATLNTNLAAAGFTSATLPTTGTTTTSSFTTTFLGSTINYANTDAANASDALLFRYTSPNFNGFSFDFSWTPNAANGTNNGAVVEDRTAGYTNALAFAANYSGSFDGIDLDFGAGIQWAELPDDTSALNRAIGLDDDYLAYTVGGTVGYGGFEVGVVFGHTVSDSPVNPTATISTTGSVATGALVSTTALSAAPASFESYVIGAGASYTQGPLSVGVSGTYGEGEGIAEALNASNETMYGVVGGVAYDLAPGVSVSAGVGYMSREGENDSTTVDDNDGVFGFVGVDGSF